MEGSKKMKNSKPVEIEKIPGPNFGSLEEQLETSLRKELDRQKNVVKELVKKKENLRLIICNLRIA